MRGTKQDTSRQTLKGDMPDVTAEPRSSCAAGGTSQMEREMNSWRWIKGGLRLDRSGHHKEGVRLWLGPRRRTWSWIWDKACRWVHYTPHQSLHPAPNRGEREGGGERREKREEREVSSSVCSLCFLEHVPEESRPSRGAGDTEVNVPAPRLCVRELPRTSTPHSTNAVRVCESGCQTPHSRSQSKQPELEDTKSGTDKTNEHGPAVQMYTQHPDAFQLAPPTLQKHFLWRRPGWCRQMLLF